MTIPPPLTTLLDAIIHWIDVTPPYGGGDEGITSAWCPTTGRRLHCWRGLTERMLRLGPDRVRRAREDLALDVVMNIAMQVRALATVPADVRAVYNAMPVGHEIELVRLLDLTLDGSRAHLRLPTASFLTAADRVMARRRDAPVGFHSDRARDIDALEWEVLPLPWALP